MRGSGCNGVCQATDQVLELVKIWGVAQSCAGDEDHEREKLQCYSLRGLQSASRRVRDFEGARRGWAGHTCVALWG